MKYFTDTLDGISTSDYVELIQDRRKEDKETQDKLRKKIASELLKDYMKKYALANVNIPVNPTDRDLVVVKMKQKWEEIKGRIEQSDVVVDPNKIFFNIEKAESLGNTPNDNIIITHTVEKKGKSGKMIGSTFSTKIQVTQLGEHNYDWNDLVFSKKVVNDIHKFLKDEKLPNTFSFDVDMPQVKNEKAQTLTLVSESDGSFTILDEKGKKSRRNFDDVKQYSTISSGQEPIEPFKNMISLYHTIDEVVAKMGEAQLKVASKFVNTTIIDDENQNS